MAGKHKTLPHLLSVFLLGLSAVALALSAVVQFRLLREAEGLVRRSLADDEQAIYAAGRMLDYLGSLQLGIKDVPVEHDGLIRCPETFESTFLRFASMLPSQLRQESDRISDDFCACFAKFRGLAERINSGELSQDDDFQETNKCYGALDRRVRFIRDSHLDATRMAIADLRGVHERIGYVLLLATIPSSGLAALFVLAAIGELRCRRRVSPEVRSTDGDAGVTNDGCNRGSSGP